MVRVWKAQEFECGYSLFAPVWLEEDSVASENFCGTEDAVIVSIEYFGTGLSQSLQHFILWADTLSSTDSMIHCEGRSWHLYDSNTINMVDTFGVRDMWLAFDKLNFKTDDLVFFRVRPWKNGVRKKVVWDPQIKLIPCFAKNEKNENDRFFLGGNKASESQLLQGDSLFYCPVAGKVTVDYSITTPFLTDTVWFEFWHNENLLFHTFAIGPPNSFVLPPEIIDVALNDSLRFMAKCGSNVNMHEIQWSPHLKYEYIIDNGDTIPTFVRDTINGVADSLYLLEYYISPWYEFYNYQLVTLYGNITKLANGAGIDVIDRFEIDYFNNLSNPINTDIRLQSNKRKFIVCQRYCDNSIAGK